LGTYKWKNRYSKLGVWQLYVASAFLIHVWAIILILMDISWVSERTNYWDAIGVAGYGLMFTFFESILIWAVLLLAGFTLPKEWDEDKRISLLGNLAVAASLWAIYGQLYFLLDWVIPTWIIQFLAQQNHPLRLLYIGYLVLILISILLVAYISIYSRTYRRMFFIVIDRISILMGLYIFLDVVSCIIVLVRNLG